LSVTFGTAKVSYEQTTQVSQSHLNFSTSLTVTIIIHTVYAYTHSEIRFWHSDEGSTLWSLLQWKYYIARNASVIYL